MSIKAAVLAGALALAGCATLPLQPAGPAALPGEAALAGVFDVEHTAQRGHLVRAWHDVRHLAHACGFAARGLWSAAVAIDRQRRGLQGHGAFRHETEVTECSD